jgi:hypothetical protein
MGLSFILQTHNKTSCLYIYNEQEIPLWLSLFWDSTVNVGSRLRAARPRNRCLIPGKGKRFFSSPAVAYTQPALELVSRVSLFGVKRPGREAEHISMWCRSWECVELCLHFHIRLHDVVLRHSNTYFQNFWDFGLVPSSGILENTTFLQLDLFPSSGEKGRHLLSWAPWKELISITGLHSVTGDCD